jgi:hypothetical protein
MDPFICQLTPLSHHRHLRAAPAIDVVAIKITPLVHKQFFSFMYLHGCILIIPFAYG